MKKGVRHRVITKRPAFFGKLMPKEPVDDVLVNKYHKVNKTFDRYPGRRDDIIEIHNDCAICRNGDKLEI